MMVEIHSKKTPIVYLMMMDNHRPLSIDVIERHVEHLKRLEQQDKLVLCGPMLDYEGGLVILHADSKEEAALLADADPFIAEGYKTYQLFTIQLADQYNQYLI